MDMTPIILEQKVRKRRKKKISFLPSPERQASAALLFRRLTLRVKKFLGQLTWKKSDRVLAISLGVLGIVLLTVVFSGLGRKKVDILLPEDPVLNSSLLNVVSSEFEGQGSGEVNDMDFRFISGIDPVNYVIQSGDTLSEIARKYDISVGTLIGYNGIENVRRIYPGEVLKIPEIDGIPYKVKAGDTLESIAQAYGTNVNRLLDANDLTTNLILPGDDLFIPGGQISEYEYRKATGTLFLYPTNGRLTSYYGYRSDPFTGRRQFHYGIDIANRTGTAVTATMAGVVVDVGERPTGYGKYVIIRHSYGFQSLYAHLERVSVREGQRVEQGQRLGDMGSTGRSTGSHLHFSIYKNNSPINPLNYLF
ncbi:MAG: M23 family metallopeptidase [Spirochaetales bacterium]|nr:M23 family metallopeptidase [Spirochaetales bacterium]